MRLVSCNTSFGNGEGLKRLCPRLSRTRPVMFWSDFHGNDPDNPLLLRYKYCNWLREDMSGADHPKNKLLPKSKYSSLTQLFKSSIIGPCKLLNPNESFSNDWSWQMESSGRTPVKFWRESSISVTAPSELQVIPVKLHMELLDSQDLKALVPFDV